MNDHIFREISLAERLLNPDDLGLQATAEIRDAARVALGRQPVETAAIYPHQLRRQVNINPPPTYKKPPPPPPPPPSRRVREDVRPHQRCPECRSTLVRWFGIFGALRCVQPACRANKKGGSHE